MADHCPLGFEPPVDEAAAEHALLQQAKQPIAGKDDVFTLGTRMSKLAMVQTNLVKSQLEEQWPRTEIRIYGAAAKGVDAAERLVSLT